MFSLYTRLGRILSAGNSHTTEFHIAYALTRMLERLCEMSIGEVAEECSVSKSTLSKFVRGIGYEDYGDFRADAYQYWRKDYYISADPGSVNMNITDYLCEYGDRAYLDALKRDIDGVFSEVDAGKVDQAAQLVHDGETVLALGSGYSFTAAQNFQKKMAFYRRLVYTTEDSREQTKLIHRATSESVIVVFSNSGKYLVMYQDEEGHPEKTLFDACPARVILITANSEMARDSRVDLGIVIPQHAIVRNHPVIFQLMIERIGAAYQRMYGFPAGLMG